MKCKSERIVKTLYIFNSIHNSYTYTHVKINIWIVKIVKRDANFGIWDVKFSVPEKNLELRQKNIGDGTLQVVCYAEGVFPKPNMSLQIGNR